MATGYVPDVRRVERDDIQRGRIHNAYAVLTIGEGDQRVELAIHARGSHVHVSATAASAELAQALQSGTGDLADALSKHGLSLGDLSAGADRGASQDRQGPHESGPRTSGAATPARSSDPQPSVATGVRVVA